MGALGGLGAASGAPAALGDPGEATLGADAAPDAPPEADEAVRPSSRASGAAAPVDEAERPWRQLLRRGALTFGTSAAQIVFKVAKNVIVSRILGPANRGVFGALGVVPEFFVSLGALGFGPAMVYHVAKERQDPRRVLGAMLVFGPVMGLVLAGTCALLMDRGLVSGANAELLDRYAPFILTAIPLIMLRRLGQDLLMGQSMIGAYNLSRFLETFAPFAIFLGLWAGLGLDGLDAAVWGWFVGLAMTASVPLAAMRSVGYPPRPSLSFIRDCLSYGLRGHVGDVFHLMLLRLDFMFIAAMLGPEDLGYYAIATSVAEIVLAAPDAVFISSIAMVMRMDKERAESFTPTLVKSVFLFMFLGCLGIALLGRPLIGLLFGQKFLPAYEPMALLMPGMLFLSVFYILKADFLGRKLPGTISICSAVAAAVNVGLNLVLIPRLGVSGASVASSISYGASMLLMLALYLRISGVPPRRLLLFTPQELRCLREVLARRLPWLAARKGTGTDGRPSLAAAVVEAAGCAAPFARPPRRAGAPKERRREDD